MSWDISIQKFRRIYKSPKDIPDDERSLPLGSLPQVYAAINAVFPETNWDDPAWGSWYSTHGSIEFNIGEDDLVEDIMLHVRSYPTVVPAIVQLCKNNGWQAQDGESDDPFIDQAEFPEKNLLEWIEFRNKAARRSSCR